MRIQTLKALVIVAALYLPAANAVAQERIVTNDADQEFPRWHAFTNTLNYKDITGNKMVLSDARITVDKSGVTHLVGAVGDAGTGGGGVGYLSSEWRTRRANGFSNAVILAGPPLTIVGKADLDASPTGEIWVAYANWTNPPTNTFSTAFFVKRSPGGSFTSPTPILAGGAGTFDIVTVEQIVVDGAGTAHVLLTRSTDSLIGPSGLLYVAIVGGVGAPVVVAPASAGAFFPRIGVNAAGAASVVFGLFLGWEIGFQQGLF